MIEKNYNNIPEELKVLKQWVCFRAVESKEKPGKLDKELINPYTGFPASPINPRHWSTFSIALKQMEKYKLDGISFCLTDLEGKDLRNDIFCIDLDKVLYESENINVFQHFEANKIYQMFKGKTYIEYSMSGKGLHILGVGNLTKPTRNRKGAIEMYDNKRIMSLTGARTPDSTDTLGKLEKELREANLKYIGEVEKIDTTNINRGELSESDSELIDKIRNSRQGAKFSQLFDRGSSGDESSDDFALCRILAFWTRNDESRMDSIFRQSALMRPKWDKIHGSQTYGQMTIRNAMAKSGTTRYNTLNNLKQFDTIKRPKK